MQTAHNKQSTNKQTQYTNTIQTHIATHHNETQNTIQKKIQSTPHNTTKAIQPTQYKKHIVKPTIQNTH